MRRLLQQLARASFACDFMAATIRVSTFDGMPCTHHLVLDGAPGLDEQRCVSDSGIICPCPDLLTDALQTHEADRLVVLYTWVQLIGVMTQLDLRIACIVESKGRQSTVHGIQVSLY